MANRKVGWRSIRLLSGVLFFSSAVLSAAPGAAAPEVPFSKADFASYTGSGDATLEGESFLKTEGGEVKSCAGEKVFLAPGNPYDKHVVNRFGFAVDIALYWAGPAAPFWRKSMCDMQGKFTFTHVPKGSYYVITQVRWRTQVSSTDTQGGTMIQKIDLESGQNNAMLSMDDLQTGTSQLLGDDL